MIGWIVASDVSTFAMCIRLLQAFGSSTSKVVTMRRVLQGAGRDERLGFEVAVLGKGG